MATEWITLKHEETGAVHDFPVRTADAWNARGWKPVPPEPKTKSVKTTAATPAPDRE